MTVVLSPFAVGSRECADGTAVDVGEVQNDIRETEELAQAWQKERYCYRLLLYVVDMGG